MSIKDGLLIAMVFYAIRIIGKIAGAVIGAALVTLNSVIESINRYLRR
jgi:hypothetical protein